MKWIDESDDPRVAAIAGVLTGKSGLDSSDVWSLTRKIIEALDAPAEVEVTEPPLPPRPSGAALEGKHWWVSWYSKDPAFALWFPWWVSGWTEGGEDIIVAALIADTQEAAVELVFEAYDTRPDALEFRFIDELEAGKSPYSERFPKADWHVWSE